MSGQAILQAAALTIPMLPTTFSTGSDGFRGQGKVMSGDTKFQVQVIAVRVGSKPEGKGKATKVKAGKN